MFFSHLVALTIKNIRVGAVAAIFWTVHPPQLVDLLEAIIGVGSEQKALPTLGTAQFWPLRTLVVIDDGKDPLEGTTTGSKRLS